MSEWGIEHPSIFGNAGGCFVEGLSFVGAVVVIAALVHTLPANKKEKAQDTQVKTETVKSDTTAIPRDTVFINALSNVR